MSSIQGRIFTNSFLSYGSHHVRFADHKVVIGDTLAGAVTKDRMKWRLPLFDVPIF